MIRLTLLFFSIVLSIGLNAQRYSFLAYNSAQGLPQSQVRAIAQDQEGYLWVGTLGGLAKFNGKDFHTISTDNGLLNNRISFLALIDNAIWVGHEGGVSKISKGKISKWGFTKENKTTAVSEIIKFKNKMLIATNGGGLFELTNNKLVALSTEGKNTLKIGGSSQTNLTITNEDDLRMRDLFVDQGTLYIGTRGGVIKTKDVQVFQREKKLDLYNVSCIAKHKNSFYISTFNEGLLEYNISKQRVQTIPGIDTLLTLRSCVVDRNGFLWVNTSDGVYRLKEGKINLHLNHTNGLPMESIRSIFEDQDGDIWLGSEGKGLLRFPGEQFVYFNESTGLSSDLILSIDQDFGGNYWIGTYDKGVMVQKKDKSVVFIELENNNTVWAGMLNVDGYHWFGTYSGLVAIKNYKVVKVFYTEDGLPGDKITALHRLSNSRFYIGGSEGVSLYDKGKIRELKMNELSTIRDFCDINGVIYCASDRGLYKIEGNRLVPVGSFNKAIFSLEKDQFGKLWIGTEEGLFYYENSKFIQLTISNTPSSNIVNFLNFKDGKLFVGTNNGLFVISDLTKSKKKIVNYGIAEGVVNLETNINSGFFDQKGQFWFGTASGLVCLHSAQNGDGFSSPDLVMKNILINYQTIDFAKYSDGLTANGWPINLRLPYTKNNITFEMDGISLANYPGMKFQFFLEGQDEGWSPINSNTTITFSGLAAGTYILHARCIDSRGAISKEIHFPFTIKQAFYKTWWFIGLMLLILALVVVRIFKTRLKREREKNEKEKLEFKSRLLTLEQKSLNASMNRHFIFNSLNSIQYFINTQDRLAANKFLTNFAKLIRKNLDSSDDGNLVPLSQELERLELYMSLESMRFKDRFDYKIECDESIDTESVIIPAMMLQPFIENSIIHGILPDESRKGMITIHISLVGDLLTINIEDNGVGIDNSIQGKTNYDGDHRSQGMEITTKRIELLKKLTNRNFELIGPFQIAKNDSLINGTRVTLKFQIENLDN
jgi:ligand-binding sensor domain-containing protein